MIDRICQAIGQEKKIQRQKTTQKIRSSKQRKCTSTSPHTISESQKRESSSKKTSMADAAVD